MDLLDALKDTNAGAVFLLNQAREPALLLKLPEDVDFDAQTPIGYGVFEWYQYTPEEVIIRTRIQVYQDLHHLQQPLVEFDTFINPNDEAGALLLQKMATASFLWCIAWWNDADLTYLGRKQLRWQEEHRQSIIRLIEESKGTTTQWPAAKIRCMRENPMQDCLLANKWGEGIYRRITLEVRSDPLEKNDASGRSRREYIEELLQS